MKYNHPEYDERKKILDKSYEKLIDTDFGLMVLSDILEQTGIFERSYRSKDHSQTCFNEGKREIGIDLQERLRSIDQEKFFLIIKLILDRYDRNS